MAERIAGRGLPGTAERAPRKYEAEHAAIARRAAAEGIVLLKNEGGALPLRPGARVALYGAGASRTVKGGTGSGDVNERASISIYEGMRRAGFEIATEAWIRAYDAQYDAARLAWKQRVLARRAAEKLDFFTIYATTPFQLPAGPEVTPVEADAAVVVLSRVAGEGADRRAAKGDYYLSDEEERMLDEVCRLHERVIAIVNAGGQIDLSFLERHANIRALLYIAQPGMEGGSAVADVLSGAVSPSGKLADSWAVRFEDYPSAASYARADKPLEEVYAEGIYVGYRYFDTFAVPPRYGFGFGLSYAEFEIEPGEISTAPDGEVSVEARVRNRSAGFAGREVVQLYASLPEGKLEKEARRLCAFEKTKLLAPGESQTLTLRFRPDALASYDEARAAWVLEPGEYGLFLGNSLADSRPVATLRLRGEKVLAQARNICPPQREIEQLHLDPALRRARIEALGRGGVDLEYDLSALETASFDYAGEAPHGDAAEAIAAKLSEEQKIALVIGDPSRSQDSQLGSAGSTVPGAAGETSHCAEAEGVGSMVLADGPAGLRLTQFYYVKGGVPLMLPLEAGLEHGLFYDFSQHEGLEKRYQYCTAFPVGALLAQSWDRALLAEVGRAIGAEMREFGVALWLAPGMNLHRNPLCGRNFEYYSEDPLLAGSCAAAIVEGVQGVPGCAATIKHFACNNREDARNDSDSVLSERALRELYLRGFGIAIREGKPKAIMTSYNLINGVHAANCRDLCTDAARREFGFDGLIMTDWGTTNRGDGCTAAGCVRAGNDLTMPGQPSDFESIREALSDGSLSRGELEACAARIIRLALETCPGR